MGVPTSCPDPRVLLPGALECTIPQCLSGMVRADDRAHCCWPAQGWSTTRQTCVGIPQCPPGFESAGEACLSLDKDGDGIPDVRDKCPSEPEDMNSFEDADGCPDESRRVFAQQENLRSALETDREKHAAEIDRAQRAQWALRAQQRWESSVASARTRRTVGIVLSGIGLLAGAGSFVFMGLGAGENGSIRNGSFATGSDIASAASSGATDNTVAIVLGIAGILGCGAGVPLFLTGGTPDPPKSDTPVVSLSPMPRSAGVLAVVHFE